VKILNLIQGTPEWHAHRATHFNASDAPIMLGVSTNRKRSELLHAAATGLPHEFSDFVQKRVIDPGHAYEAKARALAEEIVGEDLFPCVGENGKFSASFDGLTMLGDVAWEHKRLNETLREAIPADGTGAANECLPEMYLVQMEHQCLVSGADRVLFTATEWEGDNLVDERRCWYTTDSTLRARVVSGWLQFEADALDYQPEDVPAVVPAGRAPNQLPVLRVEVTGMVTASNLTEFKANAFAVLDGINRDLRTDEDFANAAETVKWCESVEEKLALTKEQVLSQTADIAAVFQTMDEVSAETRRIRLELDKLVKTEKERRRSDIVAEAVRGVREHYDSINATLGQHAISVPPAIPAVIGEAIKGKKTLASIRDAANTAAATAKIDASQRADRVRANIAVLAALPDHTHLFADRVQLCATKEPADLQNLALARINEHREAEERRREADRERIRQEEADKLRRQQEEAAAQAGRERAAAEPQAPVEAAPEPAPPSIEDDLRAMEDPRPFEAAPASAPRRTVKLGDINARIAPLSITADGLAQLGFRPVGTERAAKLYAESDLISIYRAMWSVIQNAANEVKKAA
jgi:predicted phage-related endonuclease